MDGVPAGFEDIFTLEHARMGKPAADWDEHIYSLRLKSELRFERERTMMLGRHVIKSLSDAKAGITTTLHTPVGELTGWGVEQESGFLVSMSHKVSGVLLWSGGSLVKYGGSIGTTSEPAPYSDVYAAETVNLTYVPEMDEGLKNGSLVIPAGKDIPLPDLFMQEKRFQGGLARLLIERELA